MLPVLRSCCPLTLYRTLGTDAVNLAKWCRAQGFVFGEMVVQTRVKLWRTSYLNTVVS